MASELKTIRLHGALGELFGEEFRLAVGSPAEAVRALCCLCPGLQAYLMNSKDNGMEFAVYAGKRNLSLDEIRYPSGDDEIKFVPVIGGAKNGGGIMTILGAVLVVVGLVIGWTTPLGMAMLSMGGSLMIGGIMTMLAPVPKDTEDKDKKNNPSYAFNGPINTQAQGNPVPVAYGGPMYIGSAVISASISAADGSYVPDVTANPTGTAGSDGGGSAPWHFEFMSADGALVMMTGRLVRTLEATVVSAIGTLEQRVSGGTLAHTLASATITSSSTLSLIPGTGTLSRTLALATSSGVGRLALFGTGTLAQTLAPATVSGAVGVLALKATVNSTLAPTYTSSVAKVASTGTLTQTLAVASMVADGELVPLPTTGTGVLSLNLAPATVSAAGEYPVPVINLLLNGQFNSDTIWTKGLAWSIAGGKASKVSTSSATNLTQPYAFTAGKKYRISVLADTVSGTALVVQFMGGTQVQSSNITPTGTPTVYTRDLTAVAGNNTFGIRGFASWAGSVDDVVMEEIGSGLNAVLAPVTSNAAGGFNMLYNGTFDTDTIWTKETGVTITGGKAVIATAAAVRHLYQSVTTLSGVTYRLTFDISNYVSGGAADTVTAEFTGIGTIAQSNAFVRGNGSHTIEWLSNGNSSFRFRLFQNFSGEIDNAILQPLPSAPPGGGGDSMFDSYYDPAFTPVTGKTLLTTPTQTWPAAKSTGISDISYTDQRFGTKVYRAFDAAAFGSSKLRHAYSRQQAFNCDGSIILVLGGSRFYMFDAVTFDFIPGGRTGVTPSGAVGSNTIYPNDPSDHFWHPTDPNILYFKMTTGLTMYSYNVATMAVTTEWSLVGRLGAFGSAANITMAGEGRPSNDGRYWCFTVKDSGGSTLGYLCYDAGTDSIVGSLVTSVSSNWVTMSSLGTYPIIGCNTTGSTFATCAASPAGTPAGVRAYSRNFATFNQLSNDTRHSDVCIDADGDEAYVGNAGPNFVQLDWGAFWVRKCSGGLPTLLYDGGVDGATASQWHLSGCAFDRPGWAIFSTYHETSAAETAWCDHAVFAVKLGLPFDARRIAHHRGGALNDSYWDEPQATISPDGTQVLFATRFRPTYPSGALSTTEQNAYLVGLPSWFYD